MSEEAPPAPFVHCCTIFQKMKEEAKPTKVEGIHALIYEGYLTQLFQRAGLATPYYTKIMQLLKEMDCVRQISRGGGSSPSKWEMIKEPDAISFSEIEARRTKSQTKLGQVQDTTNVLAKRLSEAELRLDVLEARLEQTA
jgi:hypothetical protein